MSVPEQVPYKEYRATGSNNSFEITFYLPDPKDLVVMVNKEIPLVGAYSIQGNTVVFSTPPKEGDLIELTRDTQLDRETNFKSYDNSFRPETINFDLDKIWLVLQESNLVDAKILARLKQEIEWRRTHDFNYDELAQVREKQLFDALKGYTDTLLASTNPGVFQGVIAGVVFAQDGKSIQTHLEEILDNLAVSREDIDSKAAQQYVDQQLSLKANQATTYSKNEVDAALSTKAVKADTYTKSETNGLVNAVAGGYKGYATLALAQADQASFAPNSIIEVTNDGSNNGKYQWNGTTLTKSAYDPLEQAKLDATNKANTAEARAVSYTDKEIAKRVEQNGQAEDLKQEIDAEGKIYARYARDGSLYLTGMKGKSVQEKFETSPEYSNTTEADLVSLEDPIGAIFLRVDSKSGLRLAGQKGTVQENIALVSPKFTNVIRNKKHFFINEVQPYLNNLVASGMGIAPIPLNLMPSNYTVPDSIINSFKLTPPTGRLKIDTPYYKDDWVVHPFLIECIGTMRGYRYILAINPYTFEAHENPVIYGSNDLINFEMLTGFVQPLDTPPEGGFLSDSGFTYDLNRGELIVYWRVTRRPADGLTYTSYWCKRTKDLYAWTDKEQFFPELENSVDGLTSPAIAFDPRTNLWHLWNIKQAGVIVHRTAPDLFGEWSEPTVVPSGTTVPWHIEVRYVGDKFVMLINKRDPESNYYLAISSDGENWTFSNVPLFDVQMEALYKATFLPEFDVNDNLYLNIFYTTNHSDTPDLKRKLFNVKTNSVAI